MGETYPFPAIVNVLRSVDCQELPTVYRLPGFPVEQSIVCLDPLMRRELSERSRRQFRASRNTGHGARADGRETK